MIASKIIAGEVLPYVIGGIGARIAGSSIEEGMTTRNPHGSHGGSNTVSLQPNGRHAQDDPRRQSNIDSVLE
jgi:hypothetical protein